MTIIVDIPDSIQILAYNIKEWNMFAHLSVAGNVICGLDQGYSLYFKYIILCLRFVQFLNVCHRTTVKTCLLVKYYFEKLYELYTTAFVLYGTFIQQIIYVSF